MTTQVSREEFLLIEKEKTSDYPRHFRDSNESIKGACPQGFASYKATTSNFLAQIKSRALHPKVKVDREVHFKQVGIK